MVSLGMIFVNTKTSTNSNHNPMPNSEENFTIIKWVVGLFSGIGAITAGFITSKLDKKVSKDVFREFKIGNDLQHSISHSQLKEIKDGQAKFFEILNKKQDKKG